MDSAEQETHDLESQSSDRKLVVGIGASAGGLRPLQELFSSLPCDTGCSFIVVQHLSPDFDSVMDTLLSRHTKMPIRVIKAGMRLEPNTVYLNPPRMNAEIYGGEFVLSLFDLDSLRLPINVLFQSIGRELGRQSVSVVLSGTGSDGAKGTKSVNEWGGLTVVQSVASAEFDGMPKNSIATGVVDYVLNPTEIAKLLCDHAKSPVSLKDDRSEEDEAADLDGMNDIQVIFSLLSKEHGIDFSHYKPGTVARRIDRRLQLSRYGGLSHYAEVLRSDPKELSLLYHDLLIGVTSFFRDPDSFESLKLELMPAVQVATEEDPLRIWCAGCASGEEAYSLAIMVYEMFGEIGQLAHFKVFATDVHDRTLETATRGVYPTEVLGTLTDEQRTKFFATSGENRYRVLPRLRNHLVFAKQNVVSDPPFTKMDLVICRNLLIYLQDDAQAAAISGFSYAMKKGGLLMLGPSETLGRLADGFEAIDKTWRLFRRNEQPLDSFDPREAFRDRSSPNPGSRTFNLVEAEARSNRVPEVSYRLLADYLPSAILIDSNHNILQVFGTGANYLKSVPGKSGGNLMNSLDEGPRSALMSILLQAQGDIGKVCAAKNLRLRTQTGVRVTDVFVKAFSTSADKGAVVLVRFQEPAVEGNAGSSESADSYVIDSNESADEELRQARLTLGATIQDLEFSNQELQAANEEMIASNEELQATNEELQSVNEELQTVNVEHQRKVQELEEMTDDFNNLFNSSDIGLILLDDKLRIRKFTSAASRYFNLMQHDVGRELTNFASRIVPSDFFEHVHQVLRSGERFKTRAHDQDGKLIAIDISPYHANNEVRGVIINMTEVMVVESGNEIQSTVQTKVSSGDSPNT